MSLQDVLIPGEKVLSECKPLYATSRRIIRYDEGPGAEPMAELAYHQISGVQVRQQPSYFMMVFGALCLISALYLTLLGHIFITALPALVIGVVLMFFGAQGKFRYYQLRLRNVPPPVTTEPETNWDTTVRPFMESIGVMTPAYEALWRLDYHSGGSFIATIRTVIGHLPEV